jgi:glycerol-3-phosphate dehydrogenase
MFAIPWHGHTLVGTTDTPISESVPEPVAQQQEIDFILDQHRSILAKKPTRADILSVFAGIRPLIREGDSSNTSALSRGHTIRVENSGMITVCGGKWTTYRNMAEDCVNHAATLGYLPERECVTKHLNIHGFLPNAERLGPLAVYGSDAAAIQEIGRGERLHPALPYTEAEVIWAAREEMARSVEDVLARRTRALFLNSGAAIEMAPRVAAILARELNRDAAWEAGQVAEFRSVAAGFTADGPGNLR